MHTIGEINVVDLEEFERVATFTRLFEVAHYISRRVSEEWILEATIEPQFNILKIDRNQGLFGILFEDNKVVALDEQQLADKGCKFSLDCAGTFATIDYPALMGIPDDRKMLLANPSLAFDEFGSNPAFHLPVRKEHDLDYHELTVQLHQARSESLDFLESLRIQ